MLGTMVGRTRTRLLACTAAAFLVVAAPAAAQGTLVFHQTFAGENDLFTMPAQAGAGATLLVGGAGSQQSAAFSPDGSLVAYEDSAGNFDVMKVPAEGGTPEPIVADPAVLEGLPSFSRDGTQIAYQRSVTEYDIYVAAVEPEPTATPTPFANSFVSANDSDPDWSPVADVIVWQSNATGSDQLYIGGHNADPETTKLTSVGVAQGANSQAAFSPNGQRIAFVSNRDGDDEIYVMNADGSNPTRLTFNAGADHGPAWSPDGTQIAFASVRDDEGDFDLFVMPADGSAAPTQLNPEDDLDQGGVDWAAGPEQPALTIADASVVEGATAGFEVLLSIPANDIVTVDWATSAGSTSADDFSGGSGTLTFAPGEQSKFIQVPTTQDGADEPDETFTVALSNPCCATLADGTATGTIADDDEPAPAPAPTPVTQPTPTPAPAPAPEPNRTVVAEPVSGKVLVKLPGTRRFVDLATVKEIPNGTVLDARKGRVEIAAAQRGADDEADFYDGIFRIAQSKGLTTLTLQGAVGPCSRARASVSAKRKKKRRLWGSGKGRFRTAGKYASATVRGTTWLVEDSCSGTLTRVTRGSVTVRDRVKRKNVVVRKGRRYLARPRARR